MKSNLVKVEQHLTGIETAILRAGSQRHLADALAVSQQSVSKWVRRGHVPLRHIPEIFNLYGVHPKTLVDPTIFDIVAVEPDSQDAHAA